MKHYAPLYKIDSHGNTQVWEISVIEADTGEVNIITRHGILNGKMQTEKRGVVGKNIGRKNETSAFEQGMSEANRKWINKQKAGYTSSKSKTEAKKEDTILPMLAKDYLKYPSHLKVPFVIQPKLDGMRALLYKSDGKLQLISRVGNPIETVPHIINAAKSIDLKEGEYLDGELFTKEFPFEDFIGKLKASKSSKLKEYKTKLEKIKFYAFDYFDTATPSLGFCDRFNILKSKLKNVSDAFVLVETKKSNKFSESLLEKVRDRYIKHGYEGVMLRNLDVPYEINRRSSSLLKFKKSFSAEYQIVAFEEGKGRDKDTPIFWLITADGTRFKARPTGTLEYRHDLFKEANSLIGTLATIEFQEKTKKGVPRFPRLTRFRSDLA